MSESLLVHQAVGSYCALVKLVMYCYIFSLCYYICFTTYVSKQPIVYLASCPFHEEGGSLLDLPQEPLQSFYAESIQ